MNNHQSKKYLKDKGLERTIPSKEVTEENEVKAEKFDG